MRLPFQKENPMIFVEDANPGDRVAAVTALRDELLKRHLVGFNGISGYMSLKVGGNSKVKLTFVMHLFWWRFFNLNRLVSGKWAFSTKLRCAEGPREGSLGTKLNFLKVKITHEGARPRDACLLEMHTCKMHTCEVHAYEVYP